MGKIKILTDSAADIPKELAQKLQISVLPLTYTFDGENYFEDGISLSHSEFYRTMQSGSSMPKTAQVPADRFERAFLEALEEFDSVIAVTLSSAASGGFQSANIARRDILEKRDADITIIDSMSFSYLYGRVVVKAGVMAREGAQKEEIISMINESIPKAKAFFVTDTLEYLKAGGRINLATVLVANLLDIRPVLSIKDGLVAGSGKIRGSKQLCQKLVGELKARGEDLNAKEVIVFHTSQPEQAAKMRAAIEAVYSPASFTEIEVGTTIGSHTGPGLIGVGFIND